MRDMCGIIYVQCPSQPTRDVAGTVCVVDEVTLVQCSSVCIAATRTDAHTEHWHLVHLLHL